MQRPRVRSDLKLSGVPGVEDFLSMFIFDAAALGEFTNGIEPVLDDRTLLDFTMPRYIGSGFGMGTFTPQARQGVLLPEALLGKRGLYYYDQRRSVVPLLTNLEGEDLEELAQRIRTVERPLTVWWGKSIPEADWNRWGDEGLGEEALP